MLDTSDQIAIASLAVALIALVAAIYAIRRGDINSSAATMVTLNEAFRQAWSRYLSAEHEDGRQYEFSELMNLLEVGCALHGERSLSGVSRELTEEYLRDSLSLIEKYPDVRRRIESMRHSPTTFKYIKKFLIRMARKGHPHKIEATFTPEMTATPELPAAPVAAVEAAPVPPPG